MSPEEKLRLPVVALGAEHLVMGLLLRRNVLVYKAPENNEGYDLICMHPKPQDAERVVRVQVKSRYAIDSNREVPLAQKSIAAFDYLVAVFMNIGYYYSAKKACEPAIAPVLYTLPQAFVKEHHWQPASGGKGKLKLGRLDLSAFEGDLGLEQVAVQLKVPFPRRAA